MGEDGGRKAGDVRGRAAAGGLLLINEPFDVLDACSCETAALRSAKKAAPGKCCSLGLTEC